MSRDKFIASSKTWKILESTENPAATVLLGAGLTHPVVEVRRQSLKSLVARNHDATNMLILSHWSLYDDADFAILRAHSAQFAQAVRTLLTRGSVAIKSMMLQAISQLDLCDSFDVLLELSVNNKHPLNAQAGQCLLSLCQTWGFASRIGQARGASFRPRLIEMLHQELLRYPKNELLMQAWLSVVHWEDGQQRSLLSDTSNPVYSSMLRAFAETCDAVALQLLAGYVWRSTTPASIQSVISEQPSPLLAVEMARLVSEDQLELVLHRLHSSPPLASSACVEEDKLQLDKATYRRLLLIMAASREDASWALAKSTTLAKGSSAESRRLATEILGWIRPTSLDHLISAMQDDSTRNGGKSIYRDVHEVLSWLNHPSVPLRKASNEFFKDFTVANLLKQISVWPARMCRMMADIVALVDKNKLAVLVKNLDSPAPKKRIAALQAVEYLNCVSEVRDSVLSLLNDPRLEVRVRAIDTLSQSNDDSLLKIIPTLLADANTDIVDAANRASRRIERMKTSQA